MADDPRCVVCKKPLTGKQRRYCSQKCEGDYKQSPKGAKAYALRVSGRPWEPIADELGYKSAVVARGAARRHAKYKKLPWPLRIAR